jgi:hypothetical protein
MSLKEVAERIQREYPGIGLSYGNLRKLKFRGRITGNTDKEIYEQAVIYLFMRKNGYRTKEIIEARKFWSGEKEDRHFMGILINWGASYEANEITPKEVKSLRRLGKAILAYGYYLHAIRRGLDFVNNQITFRITTKGLNLIYTLKEVKKREEIKDEKKEYILSM